MRKRSKCSARYFAKSSLTRFEVRGFFFVRDGFDGEHAVVAFDEVDQAYKDVVEHDFRFFAAEFPKVCRILKRNDLRIVGDHVVLGAGRIGVIVGVHDLVQTHATACFDGRDDGSFHEVLASGIR